MANNDTEKSNAIGVFDDYSTAQTVARELVDAGIPRENVQIQSNLATGAVGSAGSITGTTEHREGGIAGFFRRLFGADDTSDGRYDYAEAIRRGNSIVAATVNQDTIDRAVDIMNQHGAIDIDTRVEAYRQAGYTTYDPNAPAYTAEEAARERERFGFARSSQGAQSIPVVEEELEIGKRAVRRGGVRVFTHIVEEPVEEQVTLQEEHARVQRRPANRPLGVDDAAALRDQSIEVTETVEEPVVKKRARVKEEVIVDKETTQKTQPVRDTVRRTKVEVEQLGKSGGTGTVEYTEDFRRNYQANYATSGYTYEQMEPAYTYGYRSAGDTQYRGKSWTDVESQLRTDYLRQNPSSNWDKVKGAIRYGWEKVTGKR